MDQDIIIASADYTIRKDATPRELAASRRQQLTDSTIKEQLA